MSAGYVNERELRVVGLSRSGNHAIIQWLLAQSRGRYCLLNAVQADYNPFLTVRPMVGADDPGFEANYRGFDLRGEQAGRLTPKDLLIYSHEDESLVRVGRLNFDRYHDAFVGTSRVRLDVLILRDPFNLFASRLKARYGWVSPRMAMRMWKQHAREFLARTRYLRRGPVRVSYNHWCTSRDYRHGLAAALGLVFTDEGFERVAACAGGSSFDGMTCDGRASQMQVLRRWEAFRDEPAYRSLFDREVFELSEAIFGPIPGTESLLPPARLSRTA